MQNNRSRHVLLALAAVFLIASSPLNADQYRSLYFYPAARYTYSDSNREANNAVGYQLTLGYAFDPRWSAEIFSDRDRFRRLDNASSVFTRGLGFQGTFNLSPDTDFSPLIIAGGSWLRTNQFNGQEDSPAVRGGLGFQYQPAGSALGLRADALVRHEFLNAINPRKNNYDDLIYSLGLTYRFGFAPSESTTTAYSPPASNYLPQPAVPVQKLVTASNASGAKAIHSSFRGKPSAGVATANDLDGDGIDNNHDKCSDTPGNAVVDADGCIIYLKKL